MQEGLLSSHQKDIFKIATDSHKLIETSRAHAHTHHVLITKLSDQFVFSTLMSEKISNQQILVAYPPRGKSGV